MAAAQKIAQAAMALALPTASSNSPNLQSTGILGRVKDVSVPSKIDTRGNSGSPADLQASPALAPFETVKASRESLVADPLARAAGPAERRGGAQGTQSAADDSKDLTAAQIVDLYASIESARPAGLPSALAWKAGRQTLAPEMALSRVFVRSEWAARRMSAAQTIGHERAAPSASPVVSQSQSPAQRMVQPAWRQTDLNPPGPAPASMPLVSTTASEPRTATLDEAVSHSESGRSMPGAAGALRGPLDSGVAFQQLQNSVVAPLSPSGLNAELSASASAPPSTIYSAEAVRPQSGDLVARAATGDSTARLPFSASLSSTSALPLDAAGAAVESESITIDAANYGSRAVRPAIHRGVSEGERGASEGEMRPAEGAWTSAMPEVRLLAALTPRHRRADSILSFIGDLVGVRAARDGRVLPVEIGSRGARSLGAEVLNFGARHIGAAHVSDAAPTESSAARSEGTFGDVSAVPRSFLPAFIEPEVIGSASSGRPTSSATEPRDTTASRRTKAAVPEEFVAVGSTQLATPQQPDGARQSTAFRTAAEQKDDGVAPSMAALASRGPRSLDSELTPEGRDSGRAEEFAVDVPIRGSAGESERWESPRAAGMARVPAGNPMLRPGGVGVRSEQLAGTIGIRAAGVSIDFPDPDRLPALLQRGSFDELYIRRQSLRIREGGDAPSASSGNTRSPFDQPVVAGRSSVRGEKGNDAQSPSVTPTGTQGTGEYGGLATPLIAGAEEPGSSSALVPAASSRGVHLGGMRAQDFGPSAAESVGFPLNVAGDEEVARRIEAVWTLIHVFPSSARAALDSISAVGGPRRNLTLPLLAAADLVRNRFAEGALGRGPSSSPSLALTPLGRRSAADLPSDVVSQAMAAPSAYAAHKSPLDGYVPLSGVASQPHLDGSTPLTSPADRSQADGYAPPENVLPQQWSVVGGQDRTMVADVRLPRSSYLWPRSVEFSAQVGAWTPPATVAAAHGGTDAGGTGFPAWGGIAPIGTRAVHEAFGVFPASTGGATAAGPTASRGILARPMVSPRALRPEIAAAAAMLGGGVGTPLLQLVTGSATGASGGSSSGTSSRVPPQFSLVEPPRVASAPSSESSAKIIDALRSQQQNAPSDDRVTLADLTLVATASSTSQLAASPAGGSSHSHHASHAQGGGHHHGGSDSKSPEAERLEIEVMAQHLVDEIRRRAEVTRERTGDSWES